MNKKLFYYARPNAMVDHKFSDDVAICYAESKEEAIDKFKSLYDEEVLTDETVKEVSFCRDGVAILTDY